MTNSYDLKLMNHNASQIRLSAIVLLIIALLAGCATAQPTMTPTTPAVASTDAAADVPPATITPLPTVTQSAPPPPTTSTAEQSTSAPPAAIFGRTYHQPDGNRAVFGAGPIQHFDPLDIALDGPPTWLLSAPYQDGILWVVTLADGAVQAFKVADGESTPVVIQPDRLPVGMPPILRLVEDTPTLLVPSGDFASTTHPVPLGDSADLAYIDTAGNLVVEREDAAHTLALNALPDARILVDEQARLLLLTDPTDSYGHGVLGDRIEADSVTLVETQPDLRIVQTIPIGDAWVIEGIAPIWADLDGDGRREIVVTRANAQAGAQIVAFAEDGTLRAAGPTIGQGFRWRHQLAVGQFSAHDAVELVDVLTPHIGGHVELYQLEGDQLVIKTAVRGYTSHVIGTPNLDMAVAGDWSDTGRWQLLLPTQDRTTLAAIDFANEEATVAWLLPVDERVVTNLSAATTNGQLAIGVGRSDNTLRIWQSAE